MAYNYTGRSLTCHIIAESILLDDIGIARSHGIVHVA